MALAGGYLNRLSPYGKLLDRTWRNYLYFLDTLAGTEDYVCLGVSEDVGGIAMERVDAKLKIKWGSYRYPSDKDTAEGIWDYVFDNLRQQFVVAGPRSKIGSNKYQYWIAGVDVSGKIQWEKYWADSGQSRYFSRIFKNKATGGYLLLTDDEVISDRHEFMNVDSMGNEISRAPMESNPCDNNSLYISGMSAYSDSEVVASVYKVSGCDYGTYINVYNLLGQLKRRIDTYPYSSSIYVTNDKTFVMLSGNRLLFVYTQQSVSMVVKEIISVNSAKETITIKTIKQSRDGGFYGIAEGEIAPNGWSDPLRENWIYIFKTDSLGNIYNEEEYSEKGQACMLQPNPAGDKVRVAIPYYYGDVHAAFYTLQGQMIFEDTQNEKEYVNISRLAPGVYIVQAKVLETGAMRTMKLVVE